MKGGVCLASGFCEAEVDGRHQVDCHQYVISSVFGYHGLIRLDNSLLLDTDGRSHHPLPRFAFIHIHTISVRT